MGEEADHQIILKVLPCLRARTGVGILKKEKCFERLALVRGVQSIFLIDRKVFKSI